MQNDPRKLALDIFLAWEKSRVTLDIILDRQQGQINALSLKDRRLFNAIVFGVFRHRETLDWIIGQHTHQPIQKIRLPILYLLRSAVFQLFFMDKIPAFAVLDTAVNQAKTHGGSKISGFVNAVLRKTTNFRLDLRYPETIDNPVDFIRITYSLPHWIAQKWLGLYGFDKTCALARKLLEIPRITIRANSLKTSAEKLEKELKPQVDLIEKSGRVPDTLFLAGPKLSLSQIPAFINGGFQIQDEAAQMVSLLLDPQPGENILDTCAGLGTKTCHLAQLMNNTGRITAMDIESYKLNALSQEADRLGIHIVQTQSGDLMKQSTKDFHTYFDRVLIDAPCSGLGVLRRNPDSRWRRKISDIVQMASRQKKMLNAAANLVKPGGILVYAVCSCEPEENEQVIQAFLTKRKDFSIDKDAVSDNLDPFRTQESFIKTYPLTDSMDGFFAARLKRLNKNE